MKSTMWRTVSFSAFSALLVCSSVGAANRMTVVSSHPPSKSKADLASRGELNIYVEVDGKVILFDTGGKDSPLLSNFVELGLDPSIVEAVVISHGDTVHTYGLPDVLGATAMKPTVYVPAAAGEATSQRNPGVTVLSLIHI